MMKGKDKNPKLKIIGFILCPTIFYFRANDTPQKTCGTMQTVKVMNRVIAFEIFIFALALFPSVNKGLK